ncbi:hypothetical protein [Alicycliphilus denitrificans]|uniref:hypothetical protein n=1 Tax=Alicycliphilus denitrificans TaxID=179636 RepID=UPI0013052DF8|nr:hypothetical protein [Alicycliphilus denitrificans]
MSERRACQASGIARSTLRYRAVARDDSGVIAFIQTHMALNPRHGFGLLYDSARHQGKPWGKTVLWRVYCELRLNLPRRGKKRLPARIKQPLQAAGQPNQGWSCDFMADALWSGRRFRTFVSARQTHVDRRWRPWLMIRYRWVASDAAAVLQSGWPCAWAAGSAHP